MNKSENYIIAEELYKTMNREQKKRISLDFLYNAICCFHYSPEEKIVEMLMSLDDEKFADLAEGFRETRDAVRKMQTTACQGANLSGVFASPDVEDILFYEMSNGLPIG